MTPTNIGFAPVQAAGGLDGRGRRARPARAAHLRPDPLSRRARRRDAAVPADSRPGEHSRRHLQRRRDRSHQGIEAALDWRIIAGAAPAPDLYLVATSASTATPSTATTACRSCRSTSTAPSCATTIPAGWFVAPSVEWSASDIWVDYANTTKAAGLRGAGTSTPAGPSTSAVSVFVDARNLLDETYVSNVQAAITARRRPAAYWPGDGRAFFAGLTAASDRERP